MDDIVDNVDVDYEEKFVNFFLSRHEYLMRWAFFTLHPKKIFHELLMREEIKIQ